MMSIENKETDKPTQLTAFFCTDVSATAASLMSTIYAGNRNEVP
jgi:hypothetical protein